MDVTSEFEKYIGLAPKDKIAKMIMDKIDSWSGIYTSAGLFGRWRENWNLYYNNDSNYNASRQTWNNLEISGDSGEYVKVRMNHYRNIATHILNLIFQKFPQAKAKAIQSTSAAYEEVDLYDSIIKHDRDKRGLRTEMRYAAEMALLMDTSALLLEWDMMAGGPQGAGSQNQLLRVGDIKIRAYSPLDWYTDPTKMHEDDIDWIVFRKYINRYRLIAQFPDMAEEILNASKEGEFKDISYYCTDDTVDIPVYYFYHVPIYGLATPEFNLNNGRFVIALNDDVVLYDGPNPYGRLPSFLIRPSPRINSYVGYSVMNDIAPIQKLINTIFTSICTAAITLGTPSVAVFGETKVTPSEIAGGMNLFEVPPGQTPPQGVNLLASDPKMYELINILLSQAEIISGMNSVVRGDPESIYKSGVMMNIVMTQAVQFVNWFQENIYLQYANLENHKLELYKKWANSEQIISIVGDDKVSKVERWSKNSIQQIESVAVEPVDPMFSTYAGNVMTAKDLLEAKLLKTPGQYTECLRTGDVNDILKSTSSQEMLVKKENEMIGKGKVPMVDYYDDDDYHTSEHRLAADDPQIRLTPEIYNAYLKHQQMHEQNKISKAQSADLQKMTAQAAGQESQRIEAPPQPQAQPQALPPQQ